MVGILAHRRAHRTAGGAAVGILRVALLLLLMPGVDDGYAGRLEGGSVTCRNRHPVRDGRCRDVSSAAPIASPAARARDISSA